MLERVKMQITIVRTKNFHLLASDTNAKLDELAENPSVIKVDCIYYMGYQDGSYANMISWTERIGDTDGN